MESLHRVETLISGLHHQQKQSTQICQELKRSQSYIPKKVSVFRSLRPIDSIQ
uniref:Uncharacterized protein n=1 Tax=Brassica campestris TaxID=3711 RepID=A0A3P6C2L6_BRACM|nr:unnamed protein product [Brassica rapa]